MKGPPEGRERGEGMGGVKGEGKGRDEKGRREGRGRGGRRRGGGRHYFVKYKIS